MGNVFISYSHDSAEHSERVLALANRLRKNGVDCVIDQYVVNPKEGWPKWMEKQIKEAAWVIIICTEKYWNRVTGKEKPGEGKGVKWESVLIYNNIYGDDSENDKFIPVVFDERDSSHIPDILKGVNYYCIGNEKGYDVLYRRLTEQPEVGIPDLGEVKPRPPKTVPDVPFVSSIGEAVKVSIYKLPVTTGGLFGREKELRFLDTSWTDGNTHIVTLVAWGGVGKTALVNEWLNRMQRQNYGGAQRVYGWSFYSQGAEEGKQASADEFFQETLAWFGDTDPKAGSNVDKGRRLARLVRKQKTLIILDGLEPLQYPPGEVHGFDGQLKDKGMAAFLKELAASCPGGGDGDADVDGCGLCVVTTRENITDLANKTGHAVKEVMLEHLSEEAGAKLLRSLGVTTCMDADVTAAVKEYEGHALALTLLGNYIKRKHKGDIRKRDKIPQLTKERLKGGHARRVMDAYERWLGESVERDILYIMGLFDRPAEAGAIEFLKSAPAIPGVTDHLQELPEEDWEEALSSLRTVRLLGEENPKKPGTQGSLDCHPLVREHFGERLREKNPGGWKAAHERLYRYFKDLPEKELPDTLAEMEPLFAAVAHGCKAGIHQAVWDNVYFKRIKRGNEHYNTFNLGGYGLDLAAISHFFDVLWSQPAANLRKEVESLALNWAYVDLRAVGRMQEAIQPLKTAIDKIIQNKDWENTARGAGSLSELLLVLGDVPQAVNYARQSVNYADLSGDWVQKMHKRTILADTLYQCGAVTEAEECFREADEVQKKRHPEFPLLYPLLGSKLCDFLLGQGKYKEVIAWVEKVCEPGQASDSLQDISLVNLISGRAWMMQAAEEKSGDFSRAMNFLNKAVEGFRMLQFQEYFLRGLIARAECCRRMGAFSKARDDLDEAKEIAETGDMKLFLCDYHLEAAKLCRAEGNETGAALHAQTAGKLIEETKYYRKKDESIMQNG